MYPAYSFAPTLYQIGKEKSRFLKDLEFPKIC